MLRREGCTGEFPSGFVIAHKECKVVFPILDLKFQADLQTTLAPSIQRKLIAERVDRVRYQYLCFFYGASTYTSFANRRFTAKAGGKAMVQSVTSEIQSSLSVGDEETEGTPNHVVILPQS